MTRSGIFAMGFLPRWALSAVLAASALIAGLAWWSGAPAAAGLAAASAPILLVLLAQARFLARCCPWLVPMYALALAQAAHVVEHGAQLAQLHVLGVAPPAAHGIVGELDLEWVHFGWNTFVLAATALLLVRSRRNPWLWVLFAAAALHEIEHAFIVSAYIATGRVGTPGLFAAGGAVLGGLPIARPDLHALYNLLELALLWMALGREIVRSRTAQFARSAVHRHPHVMRTARAAVDRGRQGASLATLSGPR